MEKIIKLNINQQSDNLYMESICIPREVEQIHIRVEYPKVFEYMGFLILSDANQVIRLQKLLGYGEQNLGIGTTTQLTTIGGVAGKIAPGNWTLLFGIFTEYVRQRLGTETVEVRIIITDEVAPITEPIDGGSWCDGSSGLSVVNYDWNEVKQSGPRWYKGDCHTHTTLSDGKETVKHAMVKANALEMDFYIPTEHNLMHTGWCTTDVLVVPGIEITTERGHFNLFGITDMPEHLMDVVKNNGQEVIDEYISKILAEANQKNWVASINHPFLSIWKWQCDKLPLEQIDCIEIVNDPTYPLAKESNDLAIQFLDKLWQDGHKIYGVGGSDAHNLIDERYEGAKEPSVAGDPGTYVYCNELSAKELLNNLSQGHVCVTRFCKVIPTITANGRGYLPGDEILINKATVVELEIKVLEVEEEPIIYCIHNGMKIQLELERFEDGYQASTQVKFEENSWDWVRFEVRTRDYEFLGYTNPVYHGTKTPNYHTFGEAKDGMEK